MKIDFAELWVHVHGASTHFPIALLIVSLLFDLGALIFRQPNWRIVAYYTLLAAALGTIPAVLSGLTGGQGWFGIDPWTSGPVNTHRLVSLIASGIMLALALWRGLKRDALKGVPFAIYLVLVVLSSVLIGYTGWLGGAVAGVY
ncbi:MAG: DUF2231 domain-containing protein [Cytophagales bacterium]|nr:DUF2231 domain-containing protein [Armatimonadota bacterium]